MHLCPTTCPSLKLASGCLVQKWVVHEFCLESQVTEICLNFGPELPIRPAPSPDPCQKLRRLQVKEAKSMLPAASSAAATTRQVLKLTLTVGPLKSCQMA